LYVLPLPGRLSGIDDETFALEGDSIWVRRLDGREGLDGDFVSAKTVDVLEPTTFGFKNGRNEGRTELTIDDTLALPAAVLL
jgi:hypothetical protein